MRQGGWPASQVPSGNIRQGRQSSACACSSAGLPAWLWIRPMTLSPASLAASSRAWRCSQGRAVRQGRVRQGRAGQAGEDSLQSQAAPTWHLADAEPRGCSPLPEKLPLSKSRASCWCSHARARWQLSASTAGAHLLRRVRSWHSQHSVGHRGPFCSGFTQPLGILQEAGL